MALRISIIVTVVVLCQWYALSAIQRRLLFKTKRSRVIAGIILIIGIGLINFAFLKMRFASNWPEAGSPLEKYLSIAFFSFVGFCMALSVVFLIMDVFRLLWKIISIIQAYLHNPGSSINSEIESNGAVSHGGAIHNPANPGEIMPRRSFLKATTAVAVASVGGLTAVGVASAYSDPEVTEFDVDHHRLRGLTKPITVIHVTDFHIGSFFNFDNLERLVSNLNDVEGDMLVITGDIFHSKRTNVAQAAPALKKLRKRKYGNHAVLGNHDFYTGEQVSMKALTGNGINVFRNDWKTFNVGGLSLHIGGIDDPATNWLTGTEFPYYPKLMAGKPKDGGFSLLLSHRPNILPMVSKSDIDLVLAGHVHGGQVVLPALGDRSQICIADLISDYISGWYTEGQAKMYVNRGIGLTFIPWRVNCPPEITVLKLQPYYPRRLRTS